MDTFFFHSANLIFLTVNTVEKCLAAYALLELETVEAGQGALKARIEKVSGICL